MTPKFFSTFKSAGCRVLIGGNEVAPEQISSELYNWYRPGLKKRQVCFLVSDYDGPIHVPPDVFIFRTSMHRARAQSYEYLYPIHSVKSQTFEPLARAERPRISFCGTPSTYEPYRTQWLNQLQQHPALDCRFILRSSFLNLAEDFGQTRSRAEFSQNLRECEFSFCPRGTGNFSLRFYEALSHGRIPILVDTGTPLPFEDHINWQELAVIGTDVDDLIEKVIAFSERMDLAAVQKRCFETFERYFADQEMCARCLMHYMELQEPGVVLPLGHGAADAKPGEISPAALLLRALLEFAPMPLRITEAGDCRILSRLTPSQIAGVRFASPVDPWSGQTDERVGVGGSHGDELSLIFVSRPLLEEVWRLLWDNLSERGFLVSVIDPLLRPDFLADKIGMDASPLLHQCRVFGKTPGPVLNLAVFLERCMEDRGSSVRHALQRLVRPGWTCAAFSATLSLDGLNMAEMAGPNGKVFVANYYQEDIELTKRFARVRDVRSDIDYACAAITDGSEREAALLPRHWNHPNGGAVMRTAAAISIDQFFSDRPVQLIRIDANGCGGAALRGSRSVLKKQKPVVLATIRSAEERREIRSLAGLNYELFRAEDGAKLDEHVAALHVEARPRWLRAKIVMNAAKPVALDSPDHIQPWGTANDNSANPAFNEKLFQWLSRPSVSLLDIGCSGGGFVRTVLEAGCLAVGVEGSDYSLKRKRAEWNTIPDHLFTADATAPFELTLCGEDHSERLTFSVVTAWEFIEHIAEPDIEQVMRNVDKHLAPGGVVIMSVSPNEEVVNGFTLHQTLADCDWWVAKFASLGFVNHQSAVAYFGEDWIRGGADAPNSFHVVLTRANEQLPSEERLIKR